jgi:hypothetical protein
VTKRERIGQEVLHRRAQVAVLSGLAAGDDVYDLMAAVAPSHVPGWYTPDVALLELAVTALDLACPAGAEPLKYEGLRERHLPEVTFRGRVETATASTRSTPPPACAAVYSLTSRAMPAGGRPRCGSTRCSPSSSTAARRLNGSR